MTIEDVADKLLPLKAYSLWSKDQMLDAIAWHHSVGGLVVTCDGDDACICLTRRLIDPENCHDRWRNDPDGNILFCDGWHADAPHVALIALNRLVQRWSHMSHVAFERGNRGIRLFTPKFALMYAKYCFRKMKYA